MRIRDIQAFFKELDRRVSVPIKVVVTGGAAAIIQGVKRATHDIDFEITLKKPGNVDPAGWGNVQKAIDETGRATGITPQYAEDIDRWSSIALPAKTSHPYLKLGRVEVRILDPGPWSIGKLTRFLSSDVDDLRTVLKRVDSDPKKLARFWGKALGMSPLSNAQALFKRQVESFIDNHARDIWGEKMDVGALKVLFIAAAQAGRNRKLKGKSGHRE